MNPFRWTREQQLAAGAACLVGALAGVFFAWMESPFRTISVHSLSGEWSDYTEVFLTWLRVGHYWPWPLLGAAIAGLTVYAIQLLRN
jgi:hypothetical protein